MNAKVDLSNCDREPIHIAGAILPHGAMLALDSATLEILQGAGDAQGLLGASIAELARLSPSLIDHVPARGGAAIRANQRGGATKLEFAPDGVACAIALPASALLRAG